jgi:hypothetical protein
MTREIRIEYTTGIPSSVSDKDVQCKIIIESKLKFPRNNRTQPNYTFGYINDIKIDEIEEVIRDVKQELQGISAQETDCDCGWWETSTGAEFGAKRLNNVINIIEKLYHENQTFNHIINPNPNS